MRSMLLETGNPCYKVAKTLAELCLCSSVLWKVELTKLDIKLKLFLRNELKVQLGFS